jgi:O-acetyl-ADP-ribose deacetylase (regulator of RNase III)
LKPNAGYRGELRQCIYSILDTVFNYNIRSVSIPAISSGIFGYPKPLCAFDLMQALVDYAEAHKDRKQYEERQEDVLVRLVNFDDETVEIFQDEFRQRFV